MNSTEHYASFDISFEIAYLFGLGILLLVGHLLRFDFIAFTLAGMLAGRRLGWWLSKALLYQASLALTISLCVGWGVLVGFGLHGLIKEFDPGVFQRIFAYSAGGYASIPNFGLSVEHSIPTERQGRHLLIEVVPFVTFAIGSVWLALG